MTEHFTLIDPKGDADVYARLSKSQEDKVGTVAVQVKNVTRDLRKLGLSVRGTWVDDGISAWSGKERPAFLGLLDGVKKGDVRIVAAVDMDRFSRQNGETDALLVLAIKSGCRIIASGSEIDLGSPMAVGMAKIAGVLAEMESNVKSGRIKRAHAEIASQGRFHGGRRPFGFQADGVTHDETEAALYRELIQRVARGEGVRAIADDWHRREVVGPSGRAFDAIRLRYLVVSPRHTGQKVRGGKVIGSAVWEGIVTPQEQARAIAMIKGKATARAPRGESDRKALLQGFAHCGKCGHLLRIGRKSSRGEHLYRCPSIGGEACGSLSVMMRLADEEVEARFLARLTDKGTQRKLAKQQAAAPDVSRILARIDEIESDLGMLRDMLKSGECDRDYFRSSVKDLTAAKDAAQRDLETSSLPVAITTDPETLIEKWDSLLTEEKRANMAALIERIEILPHPGPNRKTWMPKERVKVTWKDAG